MAELKQADILAIFGGSGSGKTHLARLATRRDLRLLVWDFKGEYAGDIVESIALLGEFVRRPTFRVSFRPSMDAGIRARQFDTFCKIAYAVGDLRILVDEASRVTKPGWAPEGWSLCTCLGRSRGLRILAVSQRPAHVDKDIIDNATEIIAGRVNRRDSWKALEEQLGSRAAELPQLENWHFLHWKSADPRNVTALHP